MLNLDPSDPLSLILITFVAALVTDLSTGLGAVPFFVLSRVGDRLEGLLTGGAAGMMAVASLTQLAGEAMTLAPGWSVWQPALGLAAGAAFFYVVVGWIERNEHLDIANLRGSGGAAAIMIVVAMTVHSLPEGVAIGVAYGGDFARDSLAAGGGFGLTIAAALAVHNVPEGLAISAALRGRGVGPWACLGWSIFSSLPQPIAAPPAALMVWLFEPLLPAGLGFAAGAMLFLVTHELLPESTRRVGPSSASLAFAGGCVAMLVLAGAVASL